MDMYFVNEKYVSKDEYIRIERNTMKSLLMVIIGCSVAVGIPCYVDMGVRVVVYLGIFSGLACVYVIQRIRKDLIVAGII